MTRQFNFKPWGSFINILDERYTKVKQIVIKPGQSPSYQYHHKRSEIWVIVKGTAEVRIDDVVTTHTVGDIIEIPHYSNHATSNAGFTPKMLVQCLGIRNDVEI